jgi:hypothetical protein
MTAIKQVLTAGRNVGVHVLCCLCWTLQLSFVSHYYGKIVSYSACRYEHY